MLTKLRNAWGQILSVVLGVWLMAAPAVLGYGGSASAVHRILGPVSAAFAFVAVWEHMRPIRWVNVPLGLALVGAPLLFQYGLAGSVNSVLVGLLLAGLSFVNGGVEETYGGGWSSLWTGKLRGAWDAHRDG